MTINTKCPFCKIDLSEKELIPVKTFAESEPAGWHCPECLCGLNDLVKEEELK